MIRHALNLLPRPLLVAAKHWRDDRQALARHRAAIRQLKQTAAELSARCLDDIRTLQDWETRRPEFKQQLQWMLGLDPLPERAPLQAEITGTLDRPAFQIEKLVFQSQPGLYVTANFYLPKNRIGPVPCILYLCGHWPSPHGAKTVYQDRYLWYPANGFACLAVDPLQFGEVPGIHHGLHSLNLWHWLSLGYTPAGVEVWNAMRSLDWLETRPEVDARRIGVTGISGGGVMTWFLSALDDRVRAAAPSCSAYTIGSQVGLGLLGGQCDCTFYPNLFQLDFPVVGALIAPRPLLIAGGRKDPIFPPAGYRAVHTKLRRHYALHGADAAERLAFVDANAGHEDTPVSLDAARRWMRRWLTTDQGNTHVGLGTKPPPPLPPPELVCLPQRPAKALNYSIHDQFARPAQLALPRTQAEWQRRRAAVLAGLRGQVFGWLPATPARSQARVDRRGGGYAAQYAQFTEVLLECEFGASIRLARLDPQPGSTVPKAVLVLVKGTQANIVFPDLDEVLPITDVAHVLVVYPSFSEVPLGAKQQAELERSAALLGRSLAAVRIGDTIRVLQWILAEPTLSRLPCLVAGRGEAGFVGLYAALFVDHVSKVILDSPPASHRHAVPLPAVLRVTDLPEVAAILAPRRLTFVGGIPDAFQFTRHVFATAGASEAIGHADSLAEAVLA